MTVIMAGSANEGEFLTETQLTKILKACNLVLELDATKKRVRPEVNIK